MATVYRTATRVAVVALVWSTVMASHAVAQTPPDDLARDVALLRAEIQQLRAELEALKRPSEASGGGAAGTQDSPAIEMLQTQVAELAQGKVESTSRLAVRLFGTIHAGVFANSGNANWLDNPNLVGATPAGTEAGTMSASLRQTRIGFTAEGPAIGSMRTNAVVAMDFFGGIPGFQTGQVMGLPRLLVAYGRIEGERSAIEIGQDHMILAPRDPTSLAAIAFPLLFRSGNLYLRVPQVRVEHAWTSRLRTTAGIVAPVAGDLTGEAYQFVPPALSGERSRRPGVQARVAYTTGATGAERSIDIGLSGHVGWERRGAALDRSWAAAIDYAARRDIFGVAGELFAGDNMDAFGGGLGLDARSAGGWTELQLFPGRAVSVTAGFGIDDLRDSSRRLLPRQENRSVFGSVIFSLRPELQASFEYRRLTTLAGGDARRNHHFDWVFVHKF